MAFDQGQFEELTLLFLSQKQILVYGSLIAVFLIIVLIAVICHYQKEANDANEKLQSLETELDSTATMSSLKIRF